MESPHTSDRITPPSPKTEQLTCFKRSTGVKRVGVFLSSAERNKWMFDCSSSAVASPSLLSLFFIRKENWALTMKIPCPLWMPTALRKLTTTLTGVPRGRELLPAHRFFSAAAWSCSPGRCGASCSAPRSGPLSWASWAPSWPSCGGSSTAGRWWRAACGRSAAAPASPARASGWPRTCAPAASAGGNTWETRGESCKLHLGSTQSPPNNGHWDASACKEKLLGKSSKKWNNFKLKIRGKGEWNKNNNNE